MLLKKKMLNIQTTNRNLLLITIVAAFIVVVFAVGLLFFKKEYKTPVPYRPANHPANKTVKSLDKPQAKQPAKPPTKEEEKIKIKRLAENFATSYYSYTWGDFSNIESQYYFMTGEMKEREKKKVKKVKKEIENQPQKYFTVWTETIDSQFNKYNDKKASLNINMKTKEINGASVARETIVFVDTNGDIYKGNIDDLVQKTFNRSIKIDLVKISNEWKVNNIKSIN